jgi:hypothetical protein
MNSDLEVWTFEACALVLIYQQNELVADIRSPDARPSLVFA